MPRLNLCGSLKLHLLFYKSQLAWPPRCGGTVHTGNLMKALVARGAAVTLVTEQPVDDEATQWLAGVKVQPIRTNATSETETRSWPKRRLANYWGFQHSHSEWIKQFVQRENADVMVAVGLETLPYLDSIDSSSPIKRIWYPADDPTLHAYSLMGQNGFSFRQVKQMAINIAYQRAFCNSVDAAWVVSSRDQKWMSRTAGFRSVDVIANGVDSNYYRPIDEPTEPHSCIFWGRLDFSPNVHALEYFLSEVWPTVRRESPSAQFHVCGAHPTTEIRDLLKKSAGAHFHENLDDLRPRITASAVAVFPMVSGAGVKNKVLEAAAMAKPVLASKICLGGLSCEEPPPFKLLSTPQEWASALFALWSDSSKITQAGQAAREWVMRHHSWDQAALAAIRSLEALPGHPQLAAT